MARPVEHQPDGLRPRAGRPPARPPAGNECGLDRVVRVLRGDLDPRHPAQVHPPVGPGGPAEEVEGYRVDLPGVIEVELAVTPDISGGESDATLAELRVA